MLSDLEAAARHIDKANVPEDVFGVLDGLSSAERLRALTVQYRKVVLVTHPDKFAGTDNVGRAKDVFVKLTEWKRQAEKKIEAGTYGDGKAYVEPAPPAPPMGAESR